MAKGKMKNIEIVIRFIFIILFLVSFGSVSMGGVGDVYYCDETINLDIKNHKIQKFRTVPKEHQIVVCIATISVLNIG